LPVIPGPPQAEPGIQFFRRMHIKGRDAAGQRRCREKNATGSPYFPGPLQG